MSVEVLASRRVYKFNWKLNSIGFKLEFTYMYTCQFVNAPCVLSNVASFLSPKLYKLGFLILNWKMLVELRYIKYCELLNFCGVQIFVVFVEGPIHELANMYIICKYFEPHLCVIIIYIVWISTYCRCFPLYPLHTPYSPVDSLTLLARQWRKRRTTNSCRLWKVLYPPGRNCLWSSFPQAS